MHIYPASWWFVVKGTNMSSRVLFCGHLILPCSSAALLCLLSMFRLLISWSSVSQWDKCNTTYQNFVQCGKANVWVFVGDMCYKLFVWQTSTIGVQAEVTLTHCHCVQYTFRQDIIHQIRKFWWVDTSTFWIFFQHRWAFTHIRVQWFWFYFDVQHYCGKIWKCKQERPYQGKGN